MDMVACNAKVVQAVCSHSTCRSQKVCSNFYWWKSAYQGKVNASGVIRNKYLLPGHLSFKSPLMHIVGKK